MMLITGASGRIGRRTAELVASRQIPLRLMTRTPENAPRLAGTEVMRGDFANMNTLDAAFRGIEAALIISGSSPPGERALLHRNAFRAAARSGVRHVAYLSLQGSSPQSKFAFSRDHYASEQFLLAAHLPSVAILRNAFYMDMLPGFAGADGVVRDPTAGGRAAFVSREDVARAAAATMNDRVAGVYEITGPESLSVAEAVHRLSLLSGLSLRYERGHQGEAREQKVGFGPEEWRANLYTGWFEAIAAGELEHVSDAVERLTGLAPMTLEGYFSAFPAALHPLNVAPKPTA